MKPEPTQGPSEKIESKTESKIESGEKSAAKVRGETTKSEMENFTEDKVREKRQMESFRKQGLPTTGATDKFGTPAIDGHIKGRAPVAEAHKVADSQNHIHEAGIAKGAVDSNPAHKLNEQLESLHGKDGLNVESGCKVISELSNTWDKLSPDQKQQLGKDLAKYNQNHPDAHLGIKTDPEGHISTMTLYGRTFTNVPNSDMKGSYPAEILKPENSDKYPNLVDKEVMHRTLDKTNCHDYTALRLGIAPALDAVGLGAGTQLNPAFLGIAGYGETKVNSIQDLKPGDVVTVPYPHLPKEVAFGHSGVVERDPSGKLVIREKLGGGKEFVDQSPNDFAGTWSHSSKFAGNSEITVYRKQ